MSGLLSPSNFASTARGFCDWCEGANGVVSDASAAYWLARLYSEGMLLEEVGPENDWRSPEIPEHCLARAKSSLAPFWGRYYREFFNPAPELLEEPVVGDLGDDLTDTYQDIRRGLVLFDAGRTEDALWHWSFMHRIHWGQHATSALYALHCLSISRVD